MNAKQEAEKYLSQTEKLTHRGRKIFTNLLKELEATERKLAEAEKGVDQFTAIYNESEGVTGLHLNGEVATWEWLRDNEWLDSLSDYEASKGE